MGNAALGLTRRSVVCHPALLRVAQFEDDGSQPLLEASLVSLFAADDPWHARCSWGGMTYRSQLVGVFSSLLGLTTLTACSEPHPRDIFNGTVCANGQLALVHNLNPRFPADYIALQTVRGTEVQTWQEVGSCPASAPCSELTDVFDPSPWANERVAHVTKGAVEFRSGDWQIRTFLGAIDTPNEAALLLRFSNYSLDCNGPNMNQVDGGFLLYAETGGDCGQPLVGHQVFVAHDGSIVERDSDMVATGGSDCAGRLPGGLCELRGGPIESAAREAAEFFASLSYLEAAAVAAFEDLARELQAHGAPSELVARANAAAREEARHTVLTSILARRFGAERRIPTVERRPVRSLEAIAIDNAVEGLTREAFGALVATHQAQHAKDPAVRAAMGIIAHDETGHAEFSLMLHDWLHQQLSPAQRQRVARARRAAIRRFRNSTGENCSPELQRDAGMPSPAVARRLFDELFEALPSAA